MSEGFPLMTSCYGFGLPYTTASSSVKRLITGFGKWKNCERSSAGMPDLNQANLTPIAPTYEAKTQPRSSVRARSTKATPGLMLKPEPNGWF
jgi:hypothetical protein